MASAPVLPAHMFPFAARLLRDLYSAAGGDLRLHLPLPAQPSLGFRAVRCGTILFRIFGACLFAWPEISQVSQERGERCRLAGHVALRHPGVVCAMRSEE